MANKKELLAIGAVAAAAVGGYMLKESNYFQTKTSKKNEKIDQVNRDTKKETSNEPQLKKNSETVTLDGKEIVEKKINKDNVDKASATKLK